MAADSSQRFTSSSTPGWTCDGGLVSKKAFESSVASEFSPTSISSSASGWTYDVFLSFRGEDTRLGFTDHLYAALKRKGIIVFRDNEKLERGRSISRGLLNAIRESKYAVVVISKNYALSKWCLIELTEIVKCRREKQLTILPIFYNVDPSDVRKQKGSFANVFANRTIDKVDEEYRKMWRDALEEVGGLAGWDLRNRHESIVVENICEEIFGGLSYDLLNINKDHVGIESKVEELMILLQIESEDVRSIGIYGLGNSGKTTLTEIIYNRLSSHFEANCFISNIRAESGSLIHLQQQLISQILGETKLICNTFEGKRIIANRIRNKKVLVILDNMDKEVQLEALIGEHDWFGKGSRILVTSRNRRLLKKHVDEIFEVERFPSHDALQLFNLKAFKSCHFEGDQAKSAKHMVDRGLPLVLKVFHVFFDRIMDVWKSTTHQLKADPDVDVFEKLCLSFDRMGESTTKLFLAITCLFRVEIANDVIHRLESLNHFQKVDIKVFMGKSLIKIPKDGRFQMHLLQEIGNRIFRHESLRQFGQ